MTFFCWANVIGIDSSGEPWQASAPLSGTGILKKGCPAWCRNMVAEGSASRAEGWRLECQRLQTE